MANPRGTGGSSILARAAWAPAALLALGAAAAECWELADGISELNDEALWLRGTWKVTAALVAILLSFFAVILLLTTWKRHRTRPLILLLALWAFAQSIDGQHQALCGSDSSECGAGNAADLLHSIAVAAMAGTILRFAQVFPITLREADFRLTAPPGSAPPVQHRGVSRSLEQALAWLFPTRWAGRIRRSFRSSAVWLLSQRRLRNLVLAVALVLVLLRFVDLPADVLDTLAWRLSISGIVLASVAVALVYLRTGYAVGSAAARRKVLWIVEAGAVALLIVLLVAVEAANEVAAAHWLGTALSQTITRLTGIGIQLLSLAAVLCLMVAVFSRGAVDPRLALRWTLLGGVVLVAFPTLFWVVDEFLSEWLAEHLGWLPLERLGPLGSRVPVGLLAAAAVAVLVARLQPRASAAVARLTRALTARGAEAERPAFVFATLGAPEASEAASFEWSTMLSAAAGRIATSGGGAAASGASAGVFLSFPRALDALRSAVRLRDMFERGYPPLGVPPVLLRVGMHVDDGGHATSTTGADAGGCTALSVAALAAPGEVVASEMAVRALLDAAWTSGWCYAGEMGGTHGRDAIACFRYEDRASGSDPAKP